MRSSTWRHGFSGIKAQLTISSGPVEIKVLTNDIVTGRSRKTRNAPPTVPLFRGITIGSDVEATLRHGKEFGTWKVGRGVWGIVCWDLDLQQNIEVERNHYSIWDSSHYITPHRLARRRLHLRSRLGRNLAVSYFARVDGAHISVVELSRPVDLSGSGGYGCSSGVSAVKTGRE